VVAMVLAAPSCNGAFMGHRLASVSRRRSDTQRFAETPTSGTSISAEQLEAEDFVEKSDSMTSKKKSQQKVAFVNDGPFSFMTNYLSSHETGKSMAFGIPFDADENRKASSPDQIALQKQELSRNLMNIGMDERERRRQAANIFTIVTAVYAMWAALVGDHGDFQGHVLRFMSVLPMFFVLGYKKSADQGL
jgi:hypothetical protein